MESEGEQVDGVVDQGSVRVQVAVLEGKYFLLNVEQIDRQTEKERQKDKHTLDKQMDK